MKISHPRQIDGWVAVAGPAQCSCGHAHYGRTDQHTPSTVPAWRFCEDEECGCFALKLVPGVFAKSNKSGTSTRQMHAQISVRMLPEQKQLLRAVAARRGVAPAELAREAVLRELEDWQRFNDVSPDFNGIAESDVADTA